MTELGIKYNVEEKRLTFGVTKEDIMEIAKGEKHLAFPLDEVMKDLEKRRPGERNRIKTIALMDLDSFKKMAANDIINEFVEEKLSEAVKESGFDKFVESDAFKEFLKNVVKKYGDKKAE